MVRLKYDFRQQAPETLDIYLYSDVEPAYTDWWTGERQDEGSTEAFRRQLDEHPDAKRINLYVNSYGGDVKEGYGIYAILKRHAAKKVAYVDGIAASIASIICMAADEVVMYKNSVMIIHNMGMGVFGNANELRKAADDLDKMMEGNRQIYLDKAGDKLTEEQLTEMLDAETTLSAADALAYGLCDVITDAAIDTHAPAGAQEAIRKLIANQPKPPAKERALKFLGNKNKEEKKNAES